MRSPFAVRTDDAACACEGCWRQAGLEIRHALRLVYPSLRPLLLEEAAREVRPGDAPGAHAKALAVPYGRAEPEATTEGAARLVERPGAEWGAPAECTTTPRQPRDGLLAHGRRGP